MEFVLLVVLVFVLPIVTILGHALWLGIAWILRGGRPRHESARYEPTLTDDRAATVRHLDHLRSRDLIDEETHAHLMQLIAEDARQALAEPRSGASEQDQADMLVDLKPEDEHPEPAPDFEPVGTPPLAPPPARAADVAAVPITSRVTEPEAPPLPPRRPFSEVLAGFMAEKNIRWGELVGGLLIICCSTALVISLWSQISSIPTLRFLIFTGVTAAMFGAGLFVHHRWNLPTTGHAALIIGTLLVPLNLLAFAAFSTPGVWGGVWIVSAELLAIAVFAALTWLAGRVVMPNAPGLFAGGTVGMSAASLVIRFLSPRTNTTLVCTALLPVGLYVLVMAVEYWRRLRIRHVDEPGAKRLILQLGVQTFACLVPLGLLLHQFGHGVRVWQVMSPILCGVAAPALVAGVFLWRRLIGTAPVNLRTAAGSIALAAAAAMAVGVGLAWPMPARLVPCLLVNGLALIALARVTRQPVLHATAVAWFAAAWVLGVHLLGGEVSWGNNVSSTMLAVLGTVGTGQALVAVVAACAVIAIGLDRRQRRTLAVGYAMIGAVVAVLSVGFVTLFGFGAAGDPHHVTWVYAVYAVGAFVAARRLGTPLATWAGGILAHMALVQMLVYIWPLQLFAWPTTLLIGATACTAAAAALTWCKVHPDIARLYTVPLSWLTVGLSSLAMIWMASTLSADALTPFALRMVWLSALWLALAFLRRWPLLFTASQLALVAAACFALQDHLHGLPWYQDLKMPLSEPWFWHAHLLVVGGLALLWTMTRIMIDRRCAKLAALDESQETSVAGSRGWLFTASRLMNPGYLPADRGLGLVVLVSLVFVSLWSVLPGITLEHGGEVTASYFGQHTHAAGLGSWALCAIVTAIFALHLSRRFLRPAGVGLLIVMFCATALLATRFEAQHQIVIAWRWLLASAYLAASVLLEARRYWLNPVTSRLRIQTATEPKAVMNTRKLLFGVFAGPTLLLTFTFMQAIGSETALVPEGVSTLGLRTTLLGPLAILAIVLFGGGVVVRRAVFAEATAALAVAAVTTTEVCLLVNAHQPFTVTVAVWLVQVGVIVSVAIALVWHAIVRWRKIEDEAALYPRWPLIVAWAAVGIVLSLAAGALWLDPYSVPPITVAAGTVWGLSAVGLAEWALWIASRRPAREREDSRVHVWLLLAPVLLACALAPFDIGDWLCFHVLAVGLVIAGWLLLYTGVWQARRLIGSGWQETFDTASTPTTYQVTHDVSCANCGYNLRGLDPSGRCPECNAAVADTMEVVLQRLTPAWTAKLALTRLSATRTVLLCTGLGALCAVRSAYDDPQQPWWAVGLFVALSALCMTLATWVPRRSLAYLGGIGACLAASVWWWTLYWLWTLPGAAADWVNLVNVNLVALGLAGGAWLLVEQLYLQRIIAAGNPAGRSPAFHHAVALVSTLVVTALAGLTLAGVATQKPIGGMPYLTWVAWSVATALVLACTRERRFHPAPPALHILGLAGGALLLSFYNVTWPTLAWVMSLGFAGYVLAGTIVWRCWVRLARDPAAPNEARPWLTTANVTLTVLSLALSIYVSLTHADLAVRMLVAVSPALCATFAFVTHPKDRYAARETGSVALLAAAGVLFAWSWIPPDMAAGTLHRAIGVIAAVSALTVLSAVASRLVRRQVAWVRGIARTAVGMNTVAGAALAYCIVCEVVVLVQGEIVPLGWVGVWTLIAALAVMVGYCMLAALRGRFDPLRLRPRVRDAYGYGAEALVGLLVLHVRVTMPWLFYGIVTQFWPLLVTALAAAAIAGGKACDRRGWRTLARPLSRTGLILPSVALLEFFFAISQVHFSIVLLAIGSLYAVLAVLRRSISLTVAAMVTLVGSFWFFLHYVPGLGVHQHPQLWFIPPALTVLIVGHLNRARLNAKQRTTLHYACLLVIYLSSTADVFLIGVARAPWLPLVLAGLSVGGIFAGIAFHRRSFLMTGTGFLCLALLSMIWHAAENLGWTWVWWVTGIGLGVAILTVFTLFEKKRTEMTSLLEEVRDWSE